MRVLLVDSAWDKVLVDGSERRLAPLGLGYLAAVLRNNGHEPTIVSAPPLTVSDQGLEEWLARSKLACYGLIGISATTGTFRSAMSVACAAKAVTPRTPVVIGGHHVTGLGGEVVLRRWPNLFDYVIEGEGEYSLLALIAALEGCAALDYVPGLSWRDADVIRSIPPRYVEDLDLLPFPARDLLPPPEQNPLHGYGPDVSIVTSRGCTHRCGFCCVAPFFGHMWRARSAQSVMAEIDELVSLYGDHFYLHFIDDNFFVQPDRAAQIAVQLHHRYPRVSFSLATRSDQLLLGAHVLPLLRDNGCVSIELGIENGSQAMLNRLRKGLTIEQNVRALTAARNAGLDVGIDYIMFDPYTTLLELSENITFLKRTELWGNFPPLVYSSLTLYPGTPLTAAWLSEGNSPILWDRPTPCEFFDATVGEIYSRLQSFGQHQRSIYAAMKMCAKRSYCEPTGTVTPARIAAARLRLLPYQLLESLVTIGIDGWVTSKADAELSKAVSDVLEITHSILTDTKLLQPQR